MKKLFFYFLAISSLLLVSCNSDQPLGSNDGANPSKSGFGVSGLLFENNLVMWDRENQGSRSELFPQMYFTRADAADFPTWDTFPSNQMVSGGPPRDGIPALTNPRIVSSTS